MATSSRSLAVSALEIFVIVLGVIEQEVGERTPHDFVAGFRRAGDGHIPGGGFRVILGGCAVTSFLPRKAMDSKSASIRENTSISAEPPGIVGVGFWLEFPDAEIVQDAIKIPDERNASLAGAGSRCFFQSRK